MVVGARPNFMKAAPVFKELKKQALFQPVLVHTGQHYDVEMSGSFFKELDLPEPDIYLGVGSGTHAGQTGKIMIAFEKVCFDEHPDLVMVVGDVNSTIACALVAAKLGIKVAHVEAGLRSFDRNMPEEINRLLTDQISDYLFTTCEDADQNLINEGVARSKIFFVGNVMIDTLLGHQRLAEKSQITVNLGLRKEEKIRDYALLTLHRPSNVDERRTLSGLLDVLNEINSEIPVVFPAHPRTLKQIQSFGLGEKIRYIKEVAKQDWESASSPLLTLAPLGYLDFMHLMSHAKLVLTDSGGIQEETTILGIPCLTLRENTERPITVEKGTNVVVGNDPQSILTHARRVLKTGIQQKQAPKYWDGRAAQRVVNILKKTFH